MASYPPNTSTWWRIRPSASRWYPVLMCICPQQVCSDGKATVCPSRSSSVTVARPTEGNIASARQVIINATRMPPIPPRVHPQRNRATASVGTPN